MALMIKYGQIAPLTLQLEDGTESFPLTVKASVFNQDGSRYLADDITLIHIADGLFRSLDLTMPNVPELIIQYKVYDSEGVLDDSFTIESENVLLMANETEVIDTLLRSSVIEAVPVYVEQEQSPVAIVYVEEE